MDYTKTPNITSDKTEKSEKLGNLDYNLEYVDPPEAKVPFANYYNQHILPLIKEEEAKIQAKENQEITKNETYLVYFFKFIFIFLLLLFIFGYSLLFTLLMPLAQSALQVVMVLCIIVSIPILIYILARTKDKSLKSNVDGTLQIDYSSERTFERFKLHSKVSSKALKFLFPDLQELGRSPITGKELKSFCALNANWELEKQKHTYNYKKGDYKDVSFEIYQHMEYFENKLWCEYLFIILNIDTKFKGTTIIVDREFNGEDWVGDDFKHLPKIKLEGEYFDNNGPDSQKFDVYSSDQEEVKNLLNSSFMDAVLKLDDVFDQRLSQVSYNKNQVVFIIEKYNDSGTKVSYKNYVQEVQRLFKQMDIIFEIIDILKLNEQTRL